MKKFVASFSTGKDSTLAIYKAIQSGMEPVGAVITYDPEKSRAYFHNLKEPVIKRLSAAIEIPIELIPTSGDDYVKNFEQKLAEYHKTGADTCVFGDIDLEDHLIWGKERCLTAGLEPWYPLWHKERRDVVDEFIDSGFTAYITIIDTDRMSADYLGEPLTKDIVTSLEADGIDACGENGEFHTFVADGPLFKHPLEFKFGEPVLKGQFAKLPIL